MLRTDLGKTMKNEAGQVLVFVLVCMVILIAMVGFAVDVGHAYLVQRQLQSGVDAAALAGAQELPDPVPVTAVAKQYGPNGTRNPPTAIDNAATTVEMRCVKYGAGLHEQLQHLQRSQGERDLEREDVLCAYRRHRLLAGQRERDSMLSLLGQAARHHDRPGPHGLDVRRDLERHVPGRRLRNPGRQAVSRLHGSDARRGRSVGLPAGADKSSLCNQPTAGAKRYGYDALGGPKPNKTARTTKTRPVYTLASPDFNYTNMTLEARQCIKPNGTTRTRTRSQRRNTSSTPRTRQRPGRDHLPLGRRREHDAEGSPRDVPAVPSIAEAVQLRRQGRQPHQAARGRSSTRSATTSTATRTAVSAARKGLNASER